MLTCGQTRQNWRLPFQTLGMSTPVQSFLHLLCKQPEGFLLDDTFTFCGATPLLRPLGHLSLLRFLHHTQLHTNTHTHTHSVGLLWTSDQPIAEAVTYTTHNIGDERLCHQRDSNLRSQPWSGLRPPLAAQPLGSGVVMVLNKSVAKNQTVNSNGRWKQRSCHYSYLPYGCNCRNGFLGVATWLWATLSGVWIPPRATYIYLLQNVETGSGAHPASCSLGTLVLSCW